VPNDSFGLLRILSLGHGNSVDQVSSGRITLWIESLRMMARRPLFGYGEDQLMYIVPAAVASVHHPHNILIQIGFQWGVLGLAISLFLGVNAWAGLLARSLSPHSAMIPAFVTMNVLLFYAMFDGIFFFIYPCMMLSVLLAFGLSGPAVARPAIGA